MYRVVTNQSEETYTSRAVAVKAARELSTTMGGRVKVVRGEGLERMVYRRGLLEEAELVTSDRRPGGRT